MTLVSPSPAVEDVLLMSKLNEIFEIAVDDDAATQVNALAKPENHLRTVSPSAGEAVSAGQSPESLKIEEPQKRAKGPDASQMVEELCRSAVEALRRGNYEESIRLYRQALEMDGDYLPARNNLAIVYEKRPEWKQNAIEQWEVVLRLSEQMGDEKHKERAQKHLQALRG
jgi:tetratricopeptide (TPR) repeat protein